MELREWLPAEIPKPVYTTGIGKNCDLFQHCVKLAHQPAGPTSSIQKATPAGGWSTYAA